MNKSKSKLNIFIGFFKKRILSPIFLLGFTLFILILVLSLFPQIFSPYSFEQLNGYFIPAWSPPSPNHLLGTMEYGRDVFGRIFYGIQNSVFIGGLATLITLTGGLIIGALMNFIYHNYSVSTKRILIGLCIFLIILIPFLLIIILPIYNFIFLGVLLIPIIALILTRVDFDSVELAKKVLIYTPLIFGITIVIYNFVGFLGFSDPLQIHIGNDIRVLSTYLSDYSLAILYHFLSVLIMSLGSFLIFLGLKIAPRKN